MIVGLAFRFRHSTALLTTLVLSAAIAGCWFERAAEPKSDPSERVDSMEISLGSPAEDVAPASETPKPTEAREKTPAEPAPAEQHSPPPPPVTPPLPEQVPPSAADETAPPPPLDPVTPSQPQPASPPPPPKPAETAQQQPKHEKSTTEPTRPRPPKHPEAEAHPDNSRSLKPAHPEAQPPGSTVQSHASTASASKDHSYAAQVNSLVQAHKKYPSSKDAQIQRLAGTVRAWVSIARSGELLDAGIDGASPSMILDQQALRILRSVAYPPIPDGVFPGRDSQRISIALDFNPNVN